MLSYYHNSFGTLSPCDSFKQGCWVRLTNPEPREINFASSFFGIDREVLKAATDTDESSRIEQDETSTMILVNIPFLGKDRENEPFYDTLPLAIIISENAVITVCNEQTPILSDLTERKEYDPSMRSRFILQILYRIASMFLKHLKSISKLSDEIEIKLRKSTENKELIELLKLEKSLLYFTTALSSNEAVFEKLLKYEHIKKYEDDSELLDDVIVENKQAMEMAAIYSGILSGTMDAFASVISNNLSVVMRLYTMITIIMSVPGLVFGAYGMNIAGLPFSENPYSFLVVLSVSAVLTVIVTVILFKFKDRRL